MARNFLVFYGDVESALLRSYINHCEPSISSLAKIKWGISYLLIKPACNFNLMSIYHSTQLKIKEQIVAYDILPPFEQRHGDLIESFKQGGFFSMEYIKSSTRGFKVIYTNNMTAQKNKKQVNYDRVIFTLSHYFEY
jgi:hypothetical protein